jgi:hypothetical protein
MLTANCYSICSDYFSIAGLGVQEVPIVSCRPAADRCLSLGLQQQHTIKNVLAKAGSTMTQAKNEDYSCSSISTHMHLLIWVITKENFGLRSIKR